MIYSMRKLISKLTRHHWDLAFVESNDGDLLKGDWKYSFVKYSTKERWFADPFILDVTDDFIYLLVEEFTYDIKRGRIAKLTIDRKSLKLLDCKIILDLPTHLSFPAIIRQNGEVYFYPENNESGKLNLYRYDPVNDTVSLISVLAEGPLTDAVIVSQLDKPYIFTTLMTDERGNGKRLSILASECLLGEYKFCGEHIYNDNISRSAGDVFCYKGKMIRPAQIFENGRYGIGLSFQELQQKDGLIILNEIKRVYPPHKYTGQHTFNMYKNLAVVDCSAKNHRFLGPIVENAMKIARSIFRR